MVLYSDMLHAVRWDKFLPDWFYSRTMNATLKPCQSGLNRVLYKMVCRFELYGPSA